MLKSSLFCYCDHEKTVNLSGVQQNIQVIYFNVGYEAEEVVMTVNVLFQNILSRQENLVF